MDSTYSRIHLYQSVAILNILFIACGTAFAWSSPVLLKLPLTEAEGSSVASMLSLGSVLGPFISGALLDMAGRKATVGFGMTLMTGSYLLMTLSTTFTSLSVGRFLGGMAGGIIFSSVPTYIAEISEDSVRGFLNSFLQISCSTGSLLIYCVGPFVSYNVLHYLLLGVCATFLMLFPLLPNSPYTLVMNQKVDLARETLAWLRGSESSVETELQLIQKTIKDTLKDKGSIKDLFTSVGNRRALLICSGLLALQQTSGISIISFYAEKILRMTGSDIDSRFCSIIIGIIMTTTSFICPITVKHHGYKKPLFLSAVGMALGMGGLGVFFLLKYEKFHVDSLNFLPLLSIILYIIFCNIGFANIPWALTGELFPNNVKPYATTAITASCGLVAFCTTNLFSDLKNLLGLQYLFIILSIICCLSAVFIALLMQDTSGLSFPEIQLILNGKKRKDIESSKIINQNVHE